MVFATVFSASFSFIPSKISPSKALRRPPLIPLDSVFTSRPVKIIVSRIRASSPSKLATIDTEEPSCASSAWSCSCIVPISAIALVLPHIRECRSQFR